MSDHSVTFASDLSTISAYSLIAFLVSNSYFSEKSETMDDSYYYYNDDDDGGGGGGYGRVENDNSSNFTGDGEEEEEEMAMEPLAVRIAVPIIFFAIFVVGLIGNGTLIYTVAKNASMRTKPNVLIVSLALGDFLLILVSVPFNSTIYTFDEWPYGTAVCKVNEFMQTLSLGVSVFILAALSVDRFIAIVYPFTAYCSITMAKTRAAAAVIWVVSVALALVDLAAADVRPCCGGLLVVCDVYPVEWGDSYRRVRKVARFLVYFLIPVVVIATLYSLMAGVLLRKPRRGKSPTTTPARNSAGAASGIGRRIESRKRVAKVVLSFVLIFVVCWLPRNFYVLWFEYADFDYGIGWHVFKMFGFCLYFIYSAVNPFALYFLNEDFRHFFRFYLFSRCNPRWRRPPSATRMNSVQSSTIIRHSVA